MAALLSRDAPRSEHDPELAQTEASGVARHPVTGAFAKKSHEAAFRAQIFRLAFVGHVLLMTLSLAVYIFVALVALPDLRIFWSTIASITAFFTFGRVLLHHMEDTHRSQRVSSWAWTGFLTPSSVAVMYIYVVDTASTCSQVQLEYFAPLTSFATALINGSHGLGFVHKLGLIGLLLVTDLVLVSVCGELALALALCNMGALVVGSATAHMVEVYLRRSYADQVQYKRRVTEEKRRLEERKEQLQTSNERLLYDMQLRARSLDEDGRSEICRGLHAGPISDSGRTDPELAEAAIAAEVEKQSKRSSSQPLHPEINVHAPSESLLASLPPGAPSSPTSASTASSTAEADRQHYAEIAAQRAAQLMTEQKAPRPKWVETGRQFAKSVGTKRGRRAALIVPTRLEPGASPGVERVELAELAELAEETDEEVMHYLVVRHLLPAVEADQKKAGAMAVAQQSVTSHIPAASSPAAFPCSSISLQQYLPAVPALQSLPALQNMFHPRPLRSCHAPEPPQPVPQPRLFPVCKVPLQDMFATLVMRDYTPRRPSELPTSRWVSCN